MLFLLFYFYVGVVFIFHTVYFNFRFLFHLDLDLMSPSIQVNFQKNLQIYFGLTQVPSNPFDFLS